MTTPNQILNDLLAGQSTADSIAGRLRVPSLVIESMLHRHQVEGFVSSHDIADGTLTVWSLTIAGRQQTTPDRRRRKQPATR